MSDRSIDVCVVEDDDAQRRQLVDQLRRCGFAVAEAACAAEGLAEIRRSEPPVVLCDLALPDFSGVELCRQVRENPGIAGTYFVMLSARSDRVTRHEALYAGADDYLVKPCDAEELDARLRNGLRISRLQDRLRQAAVTDGMTGLANHSEFRDQMSREYARVRRYGGVVSLLMLDLDHFKAVNDTYGHEVGNDVLRAVARQLRVHVRETDMAARYGGEEFAIVLPGATAELAAALAERVRHAIAKGVRVGAAPLLRVTASIGVSSSGDPSVHSAADLIGRADHALYEAKRGGRNRVIRAENVDDGVSAPAIRAEEVERLRRDVVSLSMQMKQTCLQSVAAFVHAIETRDVFLAHHSSNVTHYVNDLADAAQWPESQRAVVSNAAMLHALGRIGLPDGVLRSRKPLSEDESSLIRQTPLITCKILEPLRVFENEIVVIRHMRERFDGGGYPHGLAGVAIPIGSRLLAVCDAFAALTSDRPHRPSRSIEEAINVIRAESGAQFDPEFVELLGRRANIQYDTWRQRIERSRVRLINQEVAA